MTIQQLRSKFSTLQLTAVEAAQYGQGVVAAQTGQTPQPHWTRQQRAGWRAQRLVSETLPELREVSHAN